MQECSCCCRLVVRCRMVWPNSAGCCSTLLAMATATPPSATSAMARTVTHRHSHGSPGTALQDAAPLCYAATIRRSD